MTLNGFFSLNFLNSLKFYERFLHRDLNKMEREHNEMLHDKLGYVSNPLNAVLLVKRLSIDVAKTRNKIVGILDDFERKLGSVRLTWNDWEGSIEGLIRLQAFYNLKSKDIARGIIQDKKYRDELTVDELFEIGSELMRSERYHASLSYLQLALDKNKENPEMPDLAIHEQIFKNHNATNNTIELIKTIDMMVELAPERKDLIELKVSLESDPTFATKKPKPVPTNAIAEEQRKGVSKEFIILSKVCTGDLRQSTEDMAKLHCRHESLNAFSKLAPFKVEQANHNPYIVIFHDVISEEEIEVFKWMSKPSLHRAGVLNPDSTTKVSTSKSFL